MWFERTRLTKMELFTPMQLYLRSYVLKRSYLLQVWRFLLLFFISNFHFMFLKVISTTFIAPRLQIYPNTSQAKIPQESCFQKYYYTFLNNLETIADFIKKKKLGSRQQSINHSLCSYILDNCKHNRIATTRTQ
jgi:hypothetical protein